MRRGGGEVIGERSNTEKRGDGSFVVSLRVEFRIWPVKVAIKQPCGRKESIHSPADRVRLRLT